MCEKVGGKWPVVVRLDVTGTSRNENFGEGKVRKVAGYREGGDGTCLTLSL